MTSRLLLLAQSHRNLFTSEDRQILFWYLKLTIPLFLPRSTSDMILIAGMTQNATVNTGKAASIAYVETSVGVTYGFAPQNASNTTSYIIPTPSELPTTASARWLSDVITITPTCAFVESNLSQPVSFDPNAIGKSNALSINLPDAGIDLVLDGTDGTPTSLHSP